jgi:putative alpha-1,2-mannosidase
MVTNHRTTWRIYITGQDKPWKTQERMRMILPRMYKPTPDGLGGNDDTGQMSAWYIFSSLGFYPVAPGNDQITALGSPAVNNAVIQVGDGKTFNISCEKPGRKMCMCKRSTLERQTRMNKISITNAGYYEWRVTLPFI